MEDQLSPNPVQFVNQSSNKQESNVSNTPQQMNDNLKPKQFIGSGEDVYLEEYYD